MEELSKDMIGALNNKAYVIGGLNIPESVIITWCIMAFLVIVSILFTRNLKIVPSKPQMVVEAIVGFINNFFTELLGERGKKYIPYLGTVLIYLGVANTIGLFGITPPTKDINMTTALALMSILLIEGSGIYEKGIKKWLHHFVEPIPIVAPINVLEVFIRPLSLCMRLFGNVLGSFVIMELLKMVVPPVLPAIFSCYFDIFDGLIQAYVFVFLTGLFIKESIE